MLPIVPKIRPNVNAGIFSKTKSLIREVLAPRLLQLIAPVSIVLPTSVAIIAIANPSGVLHLSQSAEWGKSCIIGLMFAGAVLSALTVVLHRKISAYAVSTRRNTDWMGFFSLIGLLASVVSPMILITANNRLGEILITGGFFGLLALGGWSILIIAGPWPIAVVALFGGLAIPLVPYLYFYRWYATSHGYWPESTAIVLSIPYLLFGIACSAFFATAKPIWPLEETLIAVIAPTALLFSLPLSLYIILHDRRMLQRQFKPNRTRMLLTILCWGIFILPVFITIYFTRGLALIPWAIYFATIAGIVLVRGWLREVLASR